MRKKIVATFIYGLLHLRENFRISSDGFDFRLHTIGDCFALVLGALRLVVCVAKTVNEGETLVKQIMKSRLHT